MTHSLHAPVLASLIIIRNRPEFAPGSAISTLALFTVERVGRREARFDVLHQAFHRRTTRARIIDDLCAGIAPGAELLVRMPRIDAEAHRRAHAIGAPPGATDLDLIQRQLPHNTIIPIQISDAQLVDAGRGLGLEMADVWSTPLQRKRRAPEAAMALWAIYTAAYCRGAEAKVLFAAFRAWRALQDARPITF